MTLGAAKPVRILRAIETFIAPLSPPVLSLEKSIRATPFRILISVLLSSRTQDAVTEAASARLFAVADTPAKIAKLSAERIGRLIYPAGFYRTKARNIRALSAILGRGKKFPDTLDALLELPGIGRKSANLVLALAFDRPAIAVDTHVFRISRRLGWARGPDPATVERELRELFPRRHWARVNQVLVGFGQTVCRPLNPKCGQCALHRTCPSSTIPVGARSSHPKLRPQK
jgi:endonuclease-3